MICATHATAFEVLADLLHRGYRLSVSTRVEETMHKFGTQRTTYGDRLRVEGAKPPPEELRVAIAENLDELLAVACIIRPPVPWIAELVKRCQHGHTMEAKRLVPYRKRDGTVGLKTAPVTTTTTLQTVAANLASFIGLHPTCDQERLEPIIREVLRADEAAIAMLQRKEVHNEALLEGGGIYEGYREDSEEVGCFYCHEARDEKGRMPVIMWMGGPSKVDESTTIYLHHDCAMDLCLRILRDVHESQCRGYDRNGIW